MEILRDRRKVIITVILSSLFSLNLAMVAVIALLRMDFMRILN